MASRGNQHCARGIGALSVPYCLRRTDTDCRLLGVGLRDHTDSLSGMLLSGSSQVVKKFPTSLRSIWILRSPRHCSFPSLPFELSK